VMSTPASAGRRRRAKAFAKSPLGFDGAPGNGPKPAMTTLIGLLRQHRGDLLHRSRWRQAAGGDISLDPRQS